MYCHRVGLPTWTKRNAILTHTRGFSDLIATGGSAAAAGELVKKSGGITMEYLFIVSLPFLKGHEKLDAPMYAMIDAED